MWIKDRRAAAAPQGERAGRRDAAGAGTGTGVVLQKPRGSIRATAALMQINVPVGRMLSI